MVNQVNSTNANQALTYTSYDPAAYGQTGAVTPNGVPVTELQSWLQQASAYQQQVISGQIENPGPEIMQELQNQIDYALESLNSGGSTGTDWGNNIGGAELPDGAILGPAGNFVYNQGGDKTLDFLGNNGIYDVWAGGDDSFTLNVNSASAQVDVKKGVDDRPTPPGTGENCYIVTVNDPVTGVKDTYYVHGEDFNAENFIINTATGKGVTGGEGITVGKYDPATAGAEGGAAGVDSGEGQTPVETLEDGTLVYEGIGNEPLDFNSISNGENQIHEIWGNPNINVGMRDTVTVSKGYQGHSEGFKIVVKHSDGTTDTYLVPEKFFINLNAREGSVKFIGGASGGGMKGIGDLAAGPGASKKPDAADDAGGVPDAFAEFITLNGQENDSTTIPDEVIAFAESLEIDPDKIPENLWDEIKNPGLTPSDDLVQFLGETNDKLRAALSDPALNNPDSSLFVPAWGRAKNLLLGLLGPIFGDSLSGTSEASDLSPEELAQTIFLGDTPLTIKVGGGKVKLSTEGTSSSGAKDADATESAAKALGIDEKDVPDEIAAFMKNGGALPSMVTYKGESITLEAWMAQVVPSVKAAVDAVTDPYNSDQANNVFNQIKGALQIMYRGGEIGDARISTGSSVHIGDMTMKLPDGQTYNPSVANLWPEKFAGFKPHDDKYYAKDVKDTIASLADSLGISYNDLVDRIEDSSMGADLTLKTIREAKMGYSPKDSPVWGLLLSLSPEFNQAYQTVLVNRNDSTVFAMRDIAVTLLQGLYPNHTVESGGTGDSEGDNIIFDGTAYDIFDQDAGRTGELAWDK